MSLVTQRFPQILSYHPKIGVKNGNRVSLIQLDLPDFETTEEILSSLGKKFRSKTAAELIVKLKNLREVKFAASNSNEPIIISDVQDISIKQKNIFFNTCKIHNGFKPLAGWNQQEIFQNI